MPVGVEAFGLASEGENAVLIDVKEPVFVSVADGVGDGFTGVFRVVVGGGVVEIEDLAWLRERLTPKGLLDLFPKGMMRSWGASGDGSGADVGTGVGAVLAGVGGFPVWCL